MTLQLTFIFKIEHGRQALRCLISWASLAVSGFKRPCRQPPALRGRLTSLIASCGLSAVKDMCSQFKGRKYPYFLGAALGLVVAVVFSGTASVLLMTVQLLESCTVTSVSESQRRGDRSKSTKAAPIAGGASGACDTSTGQRDDNGEW
jgi:hypothetical protein